MQIKNLLPLALATAAATQDMMNLTAAIGSIPELSSLNETLGLFESLVGQLATTENITLLAPSNTAFEEFMKGPMAELLNDTDAVQAVLQYHVLNGTYNSSMITDTPAFIPTSLTNESYANVTGGQVVKAVMTDGNVTFFSGMLANSTVTQAVRRLPSPFSHHPDSICRTLPTTTVSST